jgi:hypothetical protein
VTDASLSPAERTVRAHLNGARFQSGIDEGWWRLLSLDWPNALIAVSAAPRENGPPEFVLRFDLSGYPQPGPTAGLWDLSTNALLAPELRPKGDPAGHVFRTNWENGRALYAPWDHVALDTHGDWPQKHPRQAWHARRDLTFYLVNTWDVLNNDGYLGI